MHDALLNSGCAAFSAAPSPGVEAAATLVPLSCVSSGSVPSSKCTARRSALMAKLLVAVCLGPVGRITALCSHSGTRHSACMANTHTHTHVLPRFTACCPGPMVASRRSQETNQDCFTPAIKGHQ